MSVRVANRAAALLSCLLLGACCLDNEGRLVWSLNCANQILLASGPAPSGAGGFEPPANLRAEISDDRPGAIATHWVSCDFEAGQWQLHQAELQYPAGFRLDERGFSSVGVPGGVVGYYRIDSDIDGEVDHSYEVRSSSDYLGFLDIDEDGVEDPFEPQVALSQNVAMAPVLLLLSPLGGDDLASRMVVNRSFRATLELSPGPIQNPQQRGRYNILGQFESVDPDTGGASNGSGSPPLVLSLSVELDIGVEVMRDGFEAPTP